MEWIEDRSRVSWVSNSLEVEAASLRKAATKARLRFKKTPNDDIWGPPARAVADALEAAAATIEAHRRSLPSPPKEQE